MVEVALVEEAQEEEVEVEMVEGSEEEEVDQVENLMKDHLLKFVVIVLICFSY